MQANEDVGELHTKAQPVMLEPCVVMMGVCSSPCR